MKHRERHSKTNGIGSIINGITSFLSKGWDIISLPSKFRCDAYSSQVEYANNQLQKDGISRKERKFWAKLSEKALDGLADVHKTNSDTFIKAICAIGAGLLIGHKVFYKKQGGI